MGEHELAEYFLHQSRYAEAWANAGHELQIYVAAGYHHFDVPYDLADENGQLHRAFRSKIDFG